MSRNRKEAQEARMQSLEGEILGICARNDWGIDPLERHPDAPLTVTRRSMDAITRHIAEHYIVLSCYEYDQFSAAVKEAIKRLNKDQSKALKTVLAKFDVFLKCR